jgi:hypothetical protein
MTSMQDVISSVLGDQAKVAADQTALSVAQSNLTADQTTLTADQTTLATALASTGPVAIPDPSGSATDVYSPQGAAPGYGVQTIPNASAVAAPSPPPAPPAS